MTLFKHKHTGLIFTMTLAQYKKILESGMTGHIVVDVNA